MLKNKALTRSLALATAMVFCSVIAVCAGQLACAHADTAAGTAATRATGNAALDAQVDTVLASVTTENASQGAKLQQAWSWLTRSCKFKQISKGKQPKAKGWSQSYALKMLKSKKGNCFSFAASFAYLANALGYDATIKCGKVPVVKKGKVKKAVHAWVELKVAGGKAGKVSASVVPGSTTRIFDAEQARNGVKGQKVFNVKAGMKKSLKYKAKKKLDVKIVAAA